MLASALHRSTETEQNKWSREEQNETKKYKSNNNRKEGEAYKIEVGTNANVESVLGLQTEKKKKKFENGC